MTIYRRMASRLVALAVLAVGVITLLQPPQAAAFSCQSQCLIGYQQCRSHGALGCDAIYVDCLNSCRGI